MVTTLDAEVDDAPLDTFTLELSGAVKNIPEKVTIDGTVYYSGIGFRRTLIFIHHDRLREGLDGIEVEMTVNGRKYIEVAELTFGAEKHGRSKIEEVETDFEPIETTEIKGLVTTILPPDFKFENKGLRVLDLTKESVDPNFFAKLLESEKKKKPKKRKPK